MKPWMKSRQWLITMGLLILALAAGIGLVLTRDLGPMLAPTTSGTTAEQAPLVDERPLETARALAKLASGQDERKFADQAADLADNEVDLSFHDALRDAADHPVAHTPQNREFYEHASQSDAQVKADQDRVDQLKKRLASGGAHPEGLQEQLDVAQAQLELDQDEADDAKEDLIRSGADPASLIQRQFDQHQAAEHAADEKPATAANNPEVNYQAGSLWAQFAAWRALRSRSFPLEQARRRSPSDCRRIDSEARSFGSASPGRKKQTAAKSTGSGSNKYGSGKFGSAQFCPDKSGATRFQPIHFHPIGRPAKRIRRHADRGQSFASAVG